MDKETGKLIEARRKARVEKEERLEYELESLIKRCIDELGLEWTTDIVEVSLNRKVLK